MVVKAAALILKEYINYFTIIHDSYPPPSRIIQKINVKFPQTRQHFLHEQLGTVDMQNRKKVKYSLLS